MKVLEEGRPVKSWSTERRCTGKGNRGGGCGALLLVELTDLFRTESHALHETDHYVTFECVQCGVWTDLPDSQQPPRRLLSKLSTRSPSGRTDSFDR